MSAETVRAIVLSFLISHGYGYHADAVLQYIQGESGFQPCITGRSGSWLAQWVGVRRKALATFAGTTGCPPVQVQLEFLDQELRSGLYDHFWAAPHDQCFRVFRRTFGQGYRE